ncbi:hypothetical protein H4R26_005261 [Coemansia thaxteri]|uniref:Uncharacterized protein n=1 Tax=Coemansia thaxteri TaxID=2663907 RepID=A0A9W8EHC4_9FUNG|nr:hypothetical protein H4R26_005261 [Coemansia thaxteri]KAJ2480532.1 hypothetical protein EV174_003702 [Coemansia sp. RSA 2320]
MQFSFSALLAVPAILAVMCPQLGAAVSVTATAVSSPRPTGITPFVTKTMVARVEANLSRFVPHMLSEARMAEEAAMLHGLRPAQLVRAAATAAVSDLFWNGASAI